MQDGYDYIALVDYLRSYSQEEPWFEFKKGNSNPERIGEYVSALSNAAALSDHPLLAGKQIQDKIPVVTAVEPLSVRRSVTGVE